MVKFNEVIRIKREAFMLTQEQFAQKMGLRYLRELHLLCRRNPKKYF